MNMEGTMMYVAVPNGPEPVWSVCAVFDGWYHAYMGYTYATKEEAEAKAAELNARLGEEGDR